MSLWGKNLPNLSQLIFKYVPFFRVYSRFSLLVIITLLIIASLGFNLIINKIKSINLKIIFLIGILALITIEYSHLPKDRIQGATYNFMPGVYKIKKAWNYNYIRF
jgi:predicted tellurium resistance membrane protein TerC